MKSKKLIETAIALVAKDGGILAMDESISLLQRASNNSMANRGEYYDRLEQLFEASHYSKNKNNS